MGRPPHGQRDQTSHDEVVITVWVSGWEQECCGERFAVDREVRWHLFPPDREYFDPLFRPEDGVTITYQEEHHQHEEPPALTAGYVTAIRAVQLRYEGEKILNPVPGSAKLTNISQSDGPEQRWPGFTGYLVDLIGTYRVQPT